MDPFTNQALVIFAAVLPLLIALIKQSGWSPQANALVAFAIYIVVGVAGAWIANGVPTLETAVEWVTTVTIIGTVAYKLFWSNLGVTAPDKLSIEARVVEATSLVKGTSDTLGEG